MFRRPNLSPADMSRTIATTATPPTANLFLLFTRYLSRKDRIIPIEDDFGKVVGS
jgi:hypothetical protein